jgi:alanine racemase
MCEEEWDGVPVVDYFVFAADDTGQWSTDDGEVVEAFAYSVDSGTVSLKWQESGEVTAYDYAFNADGTLTLGIDFGYGDGYQEWVYEAVAEAAD